MITAYMMMVVSLSSGDQILLASSKAVKVTPEVHPMLFNVVEEMTIAANMPKMARERPRRWPRLRCRI